MTSLPLNSGERDETMTPTLSVKNKLLERSSKKSKETNENHRLRFIY